MKSKMKKDGKHKVNTLLLIVDTNETVKLPKGVIPANGVNISLPNDAHLYEVINVTYRIGTKRTLIIVHVEKC